MPIVTLRSSLGRLALCALLLPLSACDTNSDLFEPLTPTQPVSVTEVFRGTIDRNGANTHPFIVSVASTVTATLKTVGPDPAVLVGFSLGTWNGTTCQITLANDQALQGAVIVGNVSSFGNLCLRLYDVGKITEPTSYEVEVVHF
jgi:hypothetical protein